MPIIDIIIFTGIFVSMLVGIVRGFLREAISITALLVAIWASLSFGPDVGAIAESWIRAEELRLWFGRILVFAVILSIGGLLGWGIARLVRLSVLSGVDRLMGSLFGVARGVLLIAVLILGGQFTGFDNDGWWQRSNAIPYFEVVTEWILVMAPKGYDMLVPDSVVESLPAARISDPGVTD